MICPRKGRTFGGEMPPERRKPSAMDPVERRIRAAMTLAGIDNFADLADRIGERNLGATTLRKANRTATKTQKAAIAAACDLPYEFFTVDLGRLPELNGAHQGPELSLEQRVAELEGLVGRLVAAKSEPSSATTAVDPPVPAKRQR